MAKKSSRIKAENEPKFTVRKNSRCPLCGRPKAYMRRFDMCRICFREMAQKGLIPGVTKSSW